jgi:hypothetical protein
MSPGLELAGPVQELQMLWLRVAELILGMVVATAQQEQRAPLLD